MSHPAPDQDTASLADRLRMAPMHVLPHHALSWLMRIATRARFTAWKDWQMRWFIRRYQVNMDEALEPDPRTYSHFNAFFTRELAASARPVCDGPGDIACPADGMLSARGAIDADTLVQAKGQTFSLTRLLGGDADRARPFLGGHYATVYLSPRDYHRVHMPAQGRLREMVHVPGRLFSVNPLSTRTVNGLFARNERVVSMFDTPQGPLAVVLVGAVFVGSIETVWAGEVAPSRGHGIGAVRYPEDGNGMVQLTRGAEMGRFNMGSTAIVVLGPGNLEWAPEMTAGTPVRMGQRLATRGT